LRNRRHETVRPAEIRSQGVCRSGHEPANREEQTMNDER
jgi:hypothetical protein